jgi:hypothetical protein
MDFMFKGKTRRFARPAVIGLIACTIAGSAAAQDEEDEDESGAPAATQRGPAAENKDKRGAGRADEDPAKKAERLAKRRDRLLKSAERLRGRAAELRKKAASGEAPPANPNAKRPPKSYEEQAKKFEEQAKRMEERSKNLEAEDAARADRPERSPDQIRQRRHKIRRAQLNRRWGETLRNPDAVAELRMHAERTARLKRIRTLAQARGKDDPLAQRAGGLLKKEEERHEKRMKDIQGDTPAGKVEPASAAEESK